MSINYTLEDLNKDLDILVQDNRINTLKVFTFNEPSKKFSITLRPKAESETEYHGLHPSFDVEQLKLFLSKNRVNFINDFWTAIKELQLKDHLLNLVFKKESQQNSDLSFLVDLEFYVILLGRSILQMTSHFGFRIKVEKAETKCGAMSLIREYCSQKELPIELFVFLNNDDLNLIGIWPMDLINKLCLYYNVIFQEAGIVSLVQRDESEKSINNELYKLLTFREISLLSLVTSDVYYSGVMPKVLKITRCEDSIANPGVKTIQLNVVRTTFATVDMMDNCLVLNHPYMKWNNADELMYRMNFFEDTIQEKYLHGVNLNSEAQNINTINQYLCRSFNTNTLAVSANLVTSDNYLIVAQRSKNSIDANELYCSANGQTEFMDRNVSFYRNSVFEDMPSMDYFSKYRIDLNNEIRREIIAELGLTSFKQDWNYYGMSYLGINNYPKRKGLSLSFECYSQFKQAVKCLDCLTESCLV